MTIKYKHEADAIERSFTKDCSIIQDNISIQDENGCLFTRSVGYFAAYKNAIQQLEYAARTPGDQQREVNEKIAKLSIEGHILSTRTAFIGVKKIEKSKPESNETSKVYKLSIYHILHDFLTDNGIMSGTGVVH